MTAPSEPTFEAPPPPPTPPTEAKGPRATHLWPFAIGSFVLGLIVLGGSIAKLIPRGWTTAAALCFVGLLMFALSFIRLPLVPQKEQPLSFLGKLTGVFFEPSRVAQRASVAAATRLTSAAQALPFGPRRTRLITP